MLILAESILDVNLVNYVNEHMNIAQAVDFGIKTAIMIGMPTMTFSIIRKMFGQKSIKNDIKPMPKKNDQEVLNKSVQGYLKENQKLLKKHGLESRTILRFPRHQKLPLMLRLALFVIGRYDAVMDTEFTLRTR